MYYATKVKTLLYVSSFVCLLCVCNFSRCFTGFKVICTLVSALKLKMAAISMETKRGNFFFLFIFFHTDHKMYNEMSGLKHEQNSFLTSTSP